MPRINQLILCQLFISISTASVSAGEGDKLLASQKRPNVIIFYTDDQGSLDANCYGSKNWITPRIDRQTATGIRFTQM